MGMALTIAEEWRWSCNLPYPSSTLPSNWDHLQVCTVSTYNRDVH